MTAAIFGVTSRIGRELALRFAERNIPVWVGARDLAEAERIAADVRATPTRCRPWSNGSSASSAR
jgi:short-subunit dehydrogenase